MNKKKKAKMIKATILFIVIITLFIYIGYIMKSDNFITKVNNNKLKRNGYSEEEIAILRENDEYLTYALNHDYISNLTSLIKEEDFNIDYLDAYLEYIKNNNEAPLNDVILLVNNDINNTYSKELVSIVKEKYFIKNRLDRYLSYLDKNSNLSSKEIVSNVNCNLDYEYYTHIEKTDTSLNTLLITNKYYELDKDFNLDLVNMDSAYSRVSGAQLNKEAYEAFKKLSDTAKKENLSILNQSAYRSYERQTELYNNYLKNHTKEWTDKWSARPGHSEHQTGLALDVLTSSNKTLSDFENTKEFTWMKENSYKYGFILRYPEDATDKTGYGYEPWHYRYVGIEAAKIIYEEQITFEEYYAYYILQK